MDAGSGFEIGHLTMTTRENLVLKLPEGAIKDQRLSDRITKGVDANPGSKTKNLHSSLAPLYAEALLYVVNPQTTPFFHLNSPPRREHFTILVAFRAKGW